MNYDLSKLTGASGTELPFIAERLSSERAYQKVMRRLIVSIKQAVIDDVLPIYRLYIADGITDLIGRFTAKVKQAADSAINWVTGFVHSETDWHTDKFAQSVKTATGADVKPIVHIANMDDIKIAMIERNASLITNLADDTRQKIVQSVINASVNKKSMSELKADIEQILGGQAARADLIAQDQTIKLVADLNRYRQEQAGIKRYRWVSKQDDRVRPLHRQLNGRIYEWGKPTGAERGLPRAADTVQMQSKGYGIMAKTNKDFAMKLEPKELRKFIADSEIEAMSKIEILSLTDAELVLMVDSVINQSVNALVNTANALNSLFGNQNK